MTWRVPQPARRSAALTRCSQRLPPAAATHSLHQPACEQLARCGWVPRAAGALPVPHSPLASSTGGDRRALGSAAIVCRSSSGTRAPPSVQQCPRYGEPALACPALLRGQRCRPASQRCSRLGCCVPGAGAADPAACRCRRCRCGAPIKLPAPKPSLQPAPLPSAVCRSPASPHHVGPRLAAAGHDGLPGAGRLWCARACASAAAAATRCTCRTLLDSTPLAAAALRSHPRQAAPVRPDLPPLPLPASYASLRLPGCSPDSPRLWQQRRAALPERPRPRTQRHGRPRRRRGLYVE